MMLTHTLCIVKAIQILCLSPSCSLGVYRAIRLVASVSRVSVLKALCTEFASNDDPHVSLRTRALVAQALAEVLRHGGPASAVSQASSLQAVVSAAVSVVRNERLSEKEAAKLHPAVDLVKMSMTKEGQSDNDELEGRKKR